MLSRILPVLVLQNRPIVFNGYDILLGCVTKSRESLEIQHAECGNVGNVEKYFASLEDVIKKYNIS
jgi:hypothetical protein